MSGGLGTALIVMGILIMIGGVLGGLMSTSFTIFMNGIIAGLFLFALEKIIDTLCKILVAVRAGRTL